MKPAADLVAGVLFSRPKSIVTDCKNAPRCYDDFGLMNKFWKAGEII